jgi:hypothetical protein
METVSRFVVPYIIGAGIVLFMPQTRFERLAFRIYDAQAQFMIGGDVGAALF